MKSDGKNGETMKALQEVQEWKSEVWDDVKALPFAEAVRSIAQRAHRTAVDLGFHAIKCPVVPRCVAETGRDYVAKGE